MKNKQENCEHRIGIWRATSENGDVFYRLFCACCGQDLGDETYLPYESDKPFYFREVAHE